MFNLESIKDQGAKDVEVCICEQQGRGEDNCNEGKRKGKIWW